MKMKFIEFGLGALNSVIFDLLIKVSSMAIILKITIEQIGPVYFPKYMVDTQFLNLCLAVLLVRTLRGVFLSWRTK